ncbi:MAG: ATP-binding protein, partial [Burkholderiales bacterium]
GQRGLAHAVAADHPEHAVLEFERHALQRVRAAAQRMAALIDGLLTLSRLARAPLARRAVDLSALAREVIGELQAGEPRDGVAVHIEPGIMAEGDPTLLRIVLANLLGNAWKYTRHTPEPEIRFGTERDNDGLVYFVRDNGVGFEMQYADKLFGVFQRLHHASQFEGTGIGLATVQRVIHRHGGRVWAQAEPGHGAIFRFTLGPGLDREGAAP